MGRQGAATSSSCSSCSALIAVSALVIATKPTKLGLDLKGGVELVYQGTPDRPGRGGHRRDIERSIDIIRERIDELGVAEPEVSRARQRPRSRSASPTSPTPQRAIDQVGTTAQLFFYDWEPNLIGRETAIGGRPGSEPPAGGGQEAERRMAGSRPRPDASRRTSS